MVAWAPPTGPQYEPVAQEQVEQTIARYHQIAEAIATVAYDPDEEPVATRRFTAAMLAAISFHESRWRRDVDLGMGRTMLARTGWNGGGNAWCMMQLQLGRRWLPAPDAERLSSEAGFRILEDSALRTSEGWTGLDLLGDRLKCFRAGLHAVRLSAGAARGMGQENWLRIYTSGSMSRGGKCSAQRMWTASLFARKAPRSPTDEQIMSSLSEQAQASAD